MSPSYLVHHAPSDLTFLVMEGYSSDSPFYLLYREHPCLCRFSSNYHNAPRFLGTASTINTPSQDEGERTKNHENVHNRVKHPMTDYQNGLFGFFYCKCDRFQKHKRQEGRRPLIMINCVTCQLTLTKQDRSPVSSSSFDLPVYAEAVL